MTFHVVLDQSDSYLIESDTQDGFSFNDACAQIIEYAKEADYKRQVSRWTKVQELGLSGSIKTFGLNKVKEFLEFASFEVAPDVEPEPTQA